MELILRGEVSISWRAVYVKTNSRNYFWENQSAQTEDFVPSPVVYETLLGKGVVEDSG